jgi:ATPase subunit of ABC transporter with duplicated ATPase domains
MLRNGPALLRAISLSKSYHSALLFDGINLTLNRGDRVGLVGPNGVGKSTLLRILVGQEAPTRGRVDMGPGTSIGFLPQQVFDPNSTVGDLLRVPELDELSHVMRSLETEMAGGSPKTMRKYGEAQERWIGLAGWMHESRAREVRQRLDIAHLPDSQRLVHLSGGEQARIMLASLLLADPSLLILDEPTNHLDHAGIEWLADYLLTFEGGARRHA